jgi:hypothetical protein
MTFSKMTLSIMKLCIMLHSNQLWKINYLKKVIRGNNDKIEPIDKRVSLDYGAITLDITSLGIMTLSVREI